MLCFRRVRTAKGLTLIELLLAMSLTSCLLVILFNIHWMANKQFLKLTALSSLIEKQTLLSELFRSEISMAGYVGCPKLTTGFPLSPYPPYNLTTRNQLIITPHSFTVRYVSLCHTNLEKDMDKANIIRVSPPLPFQKGDKILISNCQAAEIFEIKTIKTDKNLQTITSTQPLHTLFSKHSEVGWFNLNKYVVEDTGRLTASGKPLLALYQININDQKIELVEGLQSLNIVKERQGLTFYCLISSGRNLKELDFYVSTSPI